MKALRLILRLVLLLLMCFWLLVMICVPGSIDSHRTKIAFNHYCDALSASTKQALDAAHRADMREAFIIEAIMASILAAAIYGFIRLGRPPVKT